jgi:hypothetical protein
MINDVVSFLKKGGQSGSNQLTQVSDPRERKRQRDRAWLAAMTEEKRNEININRRKRRAAMTDE